MQESVWAWLALDEAYFCHSKSPSGVPDFDILVFGLVRQTADISVFWGMCPVCDIWVQQRRRHMKHAKGTRRSHGSMQPLRGMLKETEKTHVGEGRFRARLELLFPRPHQCGAGSDWHDGLLCMENVQPL